MPGLFFRFTFLLFIFASLTSWAHAKESDYQAHTEVRLVVNAEEFKSNQNFSVGIHFKMDPDWHVYWKNPGDSGMTPRIDFKLPEGAIAGEVKWPIPEKINLPPLMSYGYEKDVLIAAPVKFSQDFSSSEEIIRAHVEWLACKVECIPGAAELEIKGPFKNHSELFEKTKARYPQKNLPWDVMAHRFENFIRLSINLPSASAYPIPEAYFFSESDALVDHAKKQAFTAKAKGYELNIPLAVTQPKNLQHFRGVLVSENKGWEIDIAFSKEIHGTQLGFWSAIVFAFIGGIILNLMPCVLPVLSLKVLSFAEKSKNSSKGLLKQGFIFTLGILVSFWLLAGLLIVLQAVGHEIGWGFQLQSPWFVASLAIIFFILSVNLFGFFEVGVSLTGFGGSVLEQEGWLGTFASGVLAVVVATPCTAPFMGVALGYALTQPPWVAFAIFTALGLGLAFPYFLLCMNPAWLKFIPQPGPWMLKLKKVLAFLLLLTVVWLVWIFSVQVGILDKLNLNLQKSTQGLAWQDYSKEKLEQLTLAKQPVFVDFTAAWCLTCQVNEKLVLERMEIVKLFKANNIVALKADWTNRDEEITRALAEHGRNSIPFYLLYRGDGSPPEVLPEILTVSIVKERMKDLGFQMAKKGE